MRKIIKKTGNSACIIINKEDLQIYNLKIGDIINIKISKQELNLLDDENENSN